MAVPARFAEPVSGFIEVFFRSSSVIVAAAETVLRFRIAFLSSFFEETECFGVIGIGGASVEVEADELTAEALRAALAAPVSFACGKCRHTALAQSRLNYLQTKKAGPKSYLKWCVYAGLCLLRAVKGWFQ